jgi:hypothetical protein
MKRLLGVAILFLAMVGTARLASAATKIYSGGVLDGNLYTTDSVTAATVLIGPTGISPYDIAFSPSGQLYGAHLANSVYSLYSINPITAASTFIGNLERTINGLEFRANGVLYGSGNNGLYTINTVTGLASLVGVNGGYFSAGDLAFAPDDSLFMTTTTNELVKVNPATGGATLVGAMGYSDVFGIDFIGSTLYGITAGGQLITISTVTGAGSLVTATNTGFYNGGSSVNPAVPEPSSLALMSLGGLLMMLRRRA